LRVNIRKINVLRECFCDWTLNASCRIKCAKINRMIVSKQSKGRMIFFFPCYDTYLFPTNCIKSCYSCRLSVKRQQRYDGYLFDRLLLNRTIKIWPCRTTVEENSIEKYSWNAMQTYSRYTKEKMNWFQLEILNIHYY